MGGGEVRLRLGPTPPGATTSDANHPFSAAVGSLARCSAPPRVTPTPVHQSHGGFSLTPPPSPRTHRRRGSIVQPVAAVSAGHNAAARYRLPRSGVSGTDRRGRRKHARDRGARRQWAGLSRSARLPLSIAADNGAIIIVSRPNEQARPTRRPSTPACVCPSHKTFERRGVSPRSQRRVPASVLGGRARTVCGPVRDELLRLRLSAAFCVGSIVIARRSVVTSARTTGRPSAIVSANGVPPAPSRDRGPKTIASNRVRAGDIRVGPAKRPALTRCARGGLGTSLNRGQPTTFLRQLVPTGSCGTGCRQELTVLYVYVPMEMSSRVVRKFKIRYSNIADQGQRLSRHNRFLVEN